MFNFKFTFIGLLIILYCIINSCNPQVIKHPSKIKISGLNFQSIFGQSKSDTNSIYCLLGMGFFRAESSPDTDSLIGDWLKTHKEADVIPITSMGPVISGNQNSRMIFCLVVQNGDTLNNYLIKQGCFAGGTMNRPKTKDEMNASESAILESDESKSTIDLLMEKEEFETFLMQIQYNEDYARKNKLRIWKNTEN